ncbi:MAG TPA: EAL domain-containing protein [Trichocoleus sp.]
MARYQHSSTANPDCMMADQLKVLVVEDNPDDAELLILQLEQGGYVVDSERVETASAMAAALEREPWDLVLSDYAMPSFDALSALAILQQKELDLPFIIVSGSVGEETAVQIMQEGAHDYLLKGNLTRLVATIERELREAQVRRERRQALDEIHQLAFYDSLTGLPNRALFLKQLQAHIDCARQQSSLFGLMFIDIDRYRNVKYGFGHLKSDQFLVEVARRLEAWLQWGHQLARIGENTFVILLTNLQSLEEIEHAVEQIHRSLKSPFQVEQSQIYSSASIGVVDSTLPYHHAEEFLRAADTATHNAKKQSAHTGFFNTQMQIEELERLQLETDLQQAIQQQQLQLYYQPIICLKTNKPIGFEALARWHHPQRGWVSPARFIPLAEQTGLIIPLGEWVLTEVSRQMRLWERELALALPLSIAVNVSGVQLTQSNLPDIADQLCQCYCSSQIEFELEVTESVLMDKAEHAIAVLQRIQACGIQISVDDFGTGYSSLAYLNRLPINTLKIDRSFVSQMTQDSKDFDIVKTIITLAHTLEIDVVAEGIETQAQLNLLRSLSCEYGQGYFFSKPLPPTDVPNWMQQWCIAV